MLIVVATLSFYILHRYDTDPYEIILTSQWNRVAAIDSIVRDLIELRTISICAAR